MKLKSKFLTLILTLLLQFSVFGQIFTNSSPNSFIDGTVYTTTFNVTGVDPGKPLKQVTLRFGDGGQYAGDLARAVITLTNPAGTVVNLITTVSFNNGSTITDANRRYINITLRDHAALNTPGEWLSATGNTVSAAYPFHYGYWRVPTAGSYANFTGDHNGTWTLTISYPGLSTTSGFARKYTGSDLVFDDLPEDVDIVSSAPNQSCDTKQCIETGKGYMATNTAYPNGQPNVPLTIGGCQWNLIPNNAAWFYFTATSTTVKLSISGFTKKIESVVVKSDDCQNFTLVDGGCPSTMQGGSANSIQYYNQNYAAGYSQNHGYTLTGLTIGEEYILVLDGMDQAPNAPTSSDFYIEVEEGADDGCCSGESPLFTIEESLCSGDTPPVLPTTSENGISGTWSPATVDPQNTSNYLFTPDNTECYLDTTITIAVLPAPTLSLDGTDPTCANNDGNVSATASGGTPPYTYEWTDGSGNVIGANNDQLTGLSAGMYTGSQIGNGHLLIKILKRRIEFI